MSSTTVIRYSQIESFTPTVVSKSNISDGVGWNTAVTPSTVNFTTGNQESRILQTKFGGNILTSFGGISSTKCRAVIEGVFTVSVTCTQGGTNSTPSFSIDRLPYALPNDIYYSNPNNAFGPVGNVHTYSLPAYSDLVVSGSGLLLDTPNVDNVTDSFGTALRLLVTSLATNNTIVPTNASTTSTFSGTITRSWEATTHFIDGVGGDSIPEMQMVSTMSCSALLTKDAASLFLASVSTFAESSANLTFGDASCSSAFAITATPLLITAPPVFLESNFELIASTNNLVLFDDLIVSSEFNTSSVATIKLGAIEEFSVTSNTSTNAGLIYDLLFLYTWNSFNLNTFFISGYVIEGYSAQDEYTWDDLANDSWLLYTFDTWEGKEQSWDGWPFDVWGRTFDLPMVSTTEEQGNIVRDSVANFLGQFFVADNSAFQITGFADLASQFEIVAQPKGILTGEASISSESSVEEIGNVILGGSADLSSALSFSIDVKLITDIIETESSVFSFVVDATIKRTSSADVSSQFTVDVTGARIYRVTVAITSAMAFAVEVTFVTQADPYFTIKVPQEIRTHVVPADSRVLLICQENRVNTPVHESRVLLVEQETRLHYLLIPPLTNIKSTPYERAI